jgi:aminoglycoside phosphotransferase (APT) family kinase protein
MPQQYVPPWQNVTYIATLAQKLFPESPVRITRVPEGVSTYVYQIFTEHGSFYLRILPEAGASFAPEDAVHNQLRRLGVKVPAVVYFEPYHDLLQRSIMVTTEIKGISVSQSNQLSPEARERVVIAAGRDLALINNLRVTGFGWVDREHTDADHLRAKYATFRAFTLSDWIEDLAFLSRQGLTGAELAQLEHVVGRYDSWLDVAEASLAHGDFDTTAIYQENGQYTGIIDFGEIRGAGRWYDLGHFHLRDGEQLPHRLLPALVRGYREVCALPADYLERIQFTSLLINISLLARSLRKRSGSPYTRHQFEVLRSDLAALR